MSAYRAWLDKETDIIVYGGAAGGGKSFLGCAMLILDCLSKPGTHYGMARLTRSGIYDTTLVSFREVCIKWGIEEGVQWKLCGDKIKHIKFTNGSIIYLIELNKLPRDPKWNRLGGYLLTRAFVDEVTECNEDAVSAYRVRCNRWFNTESGLKAKMMMTCNPDKGWVNDNYYRPFIDGKLPSHKKFFVAGIADNPYLSDDYAQMIDNLDEGPIKERMQGRWTIEDGIDQLISSESVEECIMHSGRQTADIGRHVNGEASGQVVYGVDVARFGDDRCVLAKMRGDTLYFLERYPAKIDVVDFGEEIHVESIDDGIEGKYIGVDVAGVGGGTKDVLKSFGTRCYEIQSGERMKACRATGSLKFFNFRSQMWWLLREDIRSGRFKIELADGRRQTAAGKRRDGLVEDTMNMLVQELTSVGYDIKNDRTIIVERKAKVKERLKRSPDYADAVVYANWMRHLYERGEGVERTVDSEREERDIWDILSSW